MIYYLLINRSVYFKAFAKDMQVLFPKGIRFIFSSNKDRKLKTFEEASIAAKAKEDEDK